MWASTKSIALMESRAKDHVDGVAELGAREFSAGEQDAWI